jgi:hypothetical protein
LLITTAKTLLITSCCTTAWTRLAIDAKGEARRGD